MPHPTKKRMLFPKLGDNFTLQNTSHNVSKITHLQSPYVPQLSEAINKINAEHFIQLIQ